MKGDDVKNSWSITDDTDFGFTIGTFALNYACYGTRRNAAEAGHSGSLRPGA